MNTSVKKWRRELEKIEENNQFARTRNKIAIFRVLYTDWNDAQNRWLIQKRPNSHTTVSLSGKELEIADKNSMDDIHGGYRTKKTAVNTAKKLAKYYSKNHRAAYVLVETKDRRFSKYMSYGDKL